MTTAIETGNSLGFWSWLRGIQADALGAGLSFRAYCYNASAENTYLRRLGLNGGISDEVAAFINSDEWVDLLKVVDGQLISGGSLGLKKVAPLAGYSWPVEDPGGGLSMLRYDVAVRSADGQERDEARDWLLTYNRGDVEATLAIRDWLATCGDSIPLIDSLDAVFEGENSSADAQSVKR
jgi:predicted RecB family nuclease